MGSSLQDHERPGWAGLSLSLELQPLGSTSDMGQGRHQRTQPLQCIVLYSTVPYIAVGKVQYCALHQPLKPLPAEWGQATEAATSPGGIWEIGDKDLWSWSLEKSRLGDNTACTLC